MDARPQRLCCSQNTTAFLENSDCSVETGPLPILLRWHIDKTTFTY
jgi:hypothetical protein